MTPKKPVNPFAAITDTPITAPPPDKTEERHREIRGILKTLEWIALALLLTSIATCVRLGN